MQFVVHISIYITFNAVYDTTYGFMLFPYPYYVLGL